MIDPKDLRIGNKVCLAHDSNIPIVTIQEIRSNGVFAFIHGDAGDNYYSFEQLMPIELTPEWLDKIDMKKRFDTETCNIWDRDDSFTRNKRFSLARLEAGWIYPTAPGCVPFLYLHQLQNLYFALTREELTIKSDSNVAL